MEYGLGGTVFTRDVEHGLDIARRVETGSIGVNFAGMAPNAPFGGSRAAASAAKAARRASRST